MAKIVNDLEQTNSKSLVIGVGEWEKKSRARKILQKNAIITKTSSGLESRREDEYRLREPTKRQIPALRVDVKEFYRYVKSGKKIIIAKNITAVVRTRVKNN